ncbi:MULTISPECIES: NUDIX domain-containing protein [unclassified Streptomyces]|uniref:NUDIX domain-containing protein n=1 Tax=unclassified Streptomyces TaxID=2593676 RepID=UPI00236691C1|nr:MULTISPECIES: NUDIX domain-containing protein [unclassified Streptomyces]MDF3139851.1 NUDIX domain-containing protein [Streptomyces sp. T21Q-yed]WDF41909.1 NUDIX domain-containing protein [Streptomyces sp. T12]
MKLRDKALCCLRVADSFLFTVRYDGQPPATTFLIPPGGGIEDGETPREAATREAHEELGCEITAWDDLGITVDEFTFRGEEYRETVHIFAADLPSGARIAACAHESNGETHPLQWLAVSDLQDGGLLIYPPGLPEVLIRYAESK